MKYYLLVVVLLAVIIALGFAPEPNKEIVLLLGVICELLAMIFLALPETLPNNLNKTNRKIRRK